MKSSSVTGQPGQRCEMKFKIAKLLLTLMVTARCLENAFQSTLHFYTILGIQKTILIHKTLAETVSTQQTWPDISHGTCKKREN